MSDNDNSSTQDATALVASQTVKAAGAISPPEPPDVAVADAGAETPEPFAPSKSTLIAYEKDARAFEQFCTANKLTAFPASREAVLNWIGTLLRDDGRPVNTLKRALSSLAHAHRARGHEPTWGTRKEILDELRACDPKAFREDLEALRTWREERADVLRFLQWLEPQAPAFARALGFVRTLVERGAHADVVTADIPVDDRFIDEGPETGPDSSTRCKFCDAIIMRGRPASDDECAAHRCAPNEGKPVVAVTGADIHSATGASARPVATGT